MLIAAVAGEIEKTQQGDAQGAEYRGYAAGSRYLVTHGGAADMCILGEPTENKLVLAHFGSLWLRLSTHGPFVHTAFSEGRRDENSILKMRAVLDAVLEWLPEWEKEMSYGDVRGVANVGSIEGGFGWRASRTPHRTDLFLDLRVPPNVPMAEARRDGARVRPLARRRRRRGLRDCAGSGDRAAPPARGRARRGAQGGLRRRPRARRHALVLGRVGADPLRHRDGQLRDVERPARPRARREPRDRGARQDRRGLRARGDEGLRSRPRTVSTPGHPTAALSDEARSSAKLQVVTCVLRFGSAAHRGRRRRQVTSCNLGAFRDLSPGAGRRVVR